MMMPAAAANWAVGGFRGAGICPCLFCENRFHKPILVLGAGALSYPLDYGVLVSRVKCHLVSFFRTRYSKKSHHPFAFTLS
jgi:hypothetical protein